MRPRRQGHRGSTLVEMSLAVLPLLAFFLGIVDISFAVFIKNTLLFAVRQGVRYAVTSQTMTGMGQDASIKTTVTNYSAGLANALSSDHNGLNHITVTYYDPSTLSVVTGPNPEISPTIGKRPFFVA